MTTDLDFSIVANNADTVTIFVYDEDDAPVNLSGMTLKWQVFDANLNPVITKNSSQIAKVADPDTTKNPLGVINGIGLSILPADTIGIPQGYYPHEAVTVSASSAPVTVTNNDAILSYGTAFIRRQLTVQP